MRNVSIVLIFIHSNIYEEMKVELHPSHITLVYCMRESQPAVA